MNEDFVTFEIAKKLEEKGFDWDTSEMFERNILACRYEDYRKPTISQVLKWLREEKKIFVEIALSPEGYRYLIYTGVCCTDTTSAFYFSFDGFWNHENNYITYEQAALAGIEYVLDNLI